MKKLYILGLAVCGFAACKPNLDPETPQKGDASFDRYLAVGNSLTAGYADGTLYRTGQQNSYPAILAEQLKTVGGGEFRQPLLPGNNGYPGAKRVLAYVKDFCDGEMSVRPILFPGAVDSAGTSNNLAGAGPFNNTGIPGIKVTDYLLPGYGSINPYSRRFFTPSTMMTATPLDEIMRLNPTFFSLWVGGNDVLGFATSGGTESGAPITASLPFFTAYDSIVTRLTKNGAKGVVMNLPDITALPYFTTIPANSLRLTMKEANDLNALYNGTGMRFTESDNNYYVIRTPKGVRQIANGELLMLNVPQDSIKCAGWGTVKPIPGNFVLTRSEIDTIQATIADYNRSITIVANENNIPIVDINSFMKTVQSGFVYNGVRYNTTFVSGGVFSLDGVHLTPRGYALVANQIIDVINNKYSSTIPKVNVNNYPGISFP